MLERNEENEIERVRQGFPLRDEAFAYSVPVGIYGPITGEWYMVLRIALAFMFSVTLFVTIM